MKSGSRLERILKAGHFAVTGELGPPKSSDPEVVRKKARILKGHVDAVNITDEWHHSVPFHHQSVRNNSKAEDPWSGGFSYSSSPIF